MRRSILAIETLIWLLSINSFADSVRRRCSVLQWNPDIATQIMVASDDDSSPTLKVKESFNVLPHFFSNLVRLVSNLRSPQSALGYEEYNVTCARVYWTPKRYFQIISIKCFFHL